MFMFVITFSMLWSFTYFFYLLYLIIIFSIIFYTLPITKNLANFSKFKKNLNFEYTSGFDLYWVMVTLLVLIFFINFSWNAPVISAWFGNLIFSTFQYKISFLIIFIFYLIISAYMTSFYFSAREIFDFLIVCINFFFWIYFLFLANTLFTVIFFIEILSTLVFLLLVSSSFSTTYFYNNLNLNLNSYFNATTPFFFLQMLMYFFWISLISSLNLFFFLILFYIKFLTLDWFIFEFIFYYIVNLNDIKDMFFIVFVWFNFLFCIFLKCGLVPFYFWKPVFFKGIPFHALFFYIFFFYFFLFLYFIYFFLIYMNDIFFFFIYVNIIILIIGFFVLLFILCEAYYIKAFLALSSILNTLFVFLALNSINISDFFFYL
jgi:hypothetical protein